MKGVKVLFLVLLLDFIPFQAAFAAEIKTLESYEPMDKGIYEHWAYEEMTDLLYADIFNGFVEHDQKLYIKPNDPITRAQFVKIIVSALGLTSNGPGKPFIDVKQNEWYSDSIRIASDLGIIHGNIEKKFYPNNNITRAEMTKIIVSSFENTVDFPNAAGKVFTDVPPSSWAYEFVQKASSANIISGYGDDFNPADYATRAEAMVMIHRALQSEKSQLPDDAVLTSLLRDYITRENSLIETGEFEGLPLLEQEKGTGYYKVGGGDPKPVDWFYPAVEEVEVKIRIDDESVQLNVLKKSNRFAVVEVKGVFYSVTSRSSTIPEYNMDVEGTMDGVYRLMKDSRSGDWRIYYYQESTAF